MNDIPVSVLHYMHLNTSAFLKHFAFSNDVMESYASNNKIRPSITRCKVEISGISCVEKCSRFAGGKSKTSKSGT